MRRLSTTFLFTLLSFAGACASTSGKCADCEKAQSVVTNVAGQYPDCVRLTVHCTMEGEMKTCASTDAARVGKAADPEDKKAVEIGDVVVLDENGAIDVTVPINRKDGKATAACGVTLKGAGMSREQAITKAKSIAMAVEAGLGGACACCCK